MAKLRIWLPTPICRTRNRQAPPPHVRLRRVRHPRARRRLPTLRAEVSPVIRQALTLLCPIAARARARWRGAIIGSTVFAPKSRRFARVDGRGRSRDSGARRWCQSRGRQKRAAYPDAERCQSRRLRAPVADYARWRPANLARHHQRVAGKNRTLADSTKGHSNAQRPDDSRATGTNRRLWQSKGRHHF